MTEALESLRAFNYQDALLHLWVFKPSTTPAKYLAWYVPTDEVSDATLRGFVVREMERITESKPYTYIGQTNESGCLSVELGETNFRVLKALVDRPEPENRANSLKKLRNASGYIVKFVHDGKIVYAARRSPASWKRYTSQQYHSRFVLEFLQHEHIRRYST